MVKRQQHRVFPEDCRRCLSDRILTDTGEGNLPFFLNMEHPMMMLFTAKWNVPKAAEVMGLPACSESWEETKILFREFCREHPPVHTFTKT